MAGVSLQFQSTDSQKIILVCVSVIVIAALVERYSGTVKETASVPQIFVGAFVAGSLLMLLSYVLPEFAVGLAAVAAVAMIISKGQPFWDAINKVFNKSGKTSVTPSPVNPLSQADAYYVATYTNSNVGPVHAVSPNG